VVVSDLTYVRVQQEKKCGLHLGDCDIINVDMCEMEFLVYFVY